MTTKTTAKEEVEAEGVVVREGGAFVVSRDLRSSRTYLIRRGERDLCQHQARLELCASSATLITAAIFTL